MRRFSEAALWRCAWILIGAFALVGAARVLVALAVGTGGRGGEGSPFSDLGLLLIVASFPVTGLLILRRQPRNRIGWLLMAIGAVWALGTAADAYARYGLLLRPGSLPHPDIAAALNAVIWAPALGLMGTFLVLTFPDGRLPSPRWRPAAWLSGLTVVALTVVLLVSPGNVEPGPRPGMPNPLGLQWAKPVLDVLFSVLMGLFPLCMAVCAVGLAVRLGRSHDTERLQLKWLATAAALVAGLFVIDMFASLVSGAASSSTRQTAWLTLLDSVSFLAFLLIPIAIGVAVLKHRLYDIDVVINRTLVYGSLTVTLTALYVGSVLLLQLFLNPLTHDSALAVAASTLGVAAVFRPARARIQSAVDRRFYRSRYDAARTLDSFASRLRHELDLDALGDDLRATVDETVHPVHVSLWIRP